MFSHLLYLLISYAPNPQTLQVRRTTRQLPLRGRGLFWTRTRQPPSRGGGPPLQQWRSSSRRPAPWRRTDYH